MSYSFDTDSQWDEISREAERALQFVHHSELAQNYALELGDGKFFAKLAYQRILASQVQFLQGGPVLQFVASVEQSVQEFLKALELGYRTEASQVNNWFFRSLVSNDSNAAHCLAAFPFANWPKGKDFPRFQASWGFSLLRGKRWLAAQELEYLMELIDGANAEAASEQPLAVPLEKNLCQLMDAVLKLDPAGIEFHLHERTKLRSIIPSEGTRYEAFQPLDFIGLGIARLARLNGVIVNVNHQSLPLVLINS